MEKNLNPKIKIEITLTETILRLIVFVPYILIILIFVARASTYLKLENLRESTLIVLFVLFTLLIIHTVCLFYLDTRSNYRYDRFEIWKEIKAGLRNLLDLEQVDPSFREASKHNIDKFDRKKQEIKEIIIEGIEVLTYVAAWILTVGFIYFILFSVAANHR